MFEYHPLHFRSHVCRRQKGLVMAQFPQSVKRFLSSEDGPTTVEYAVMLVLIVTVCLTAIQAIGNNVSAKFRESADALRPASQ